MNVVDIITSTVKSLRRPVKKGFSLFFCQGKKKFRSAKKKKGKSGNFCLNSYRPELRNIITFRVQAAGLHLFKTLFLRRGSLFSVGVRTQS